MILQHEENLSPTLSTPENTDELDKEAEKSEEKSQPENDTTVEVDTCSKTEPIDLVEVQENVEKIEIVSTKAAPEVKADMPSDSSTDTTESFKEIEDRKLEEQSSITSDGTASEVWMHGVLYGVFPCLQSMLAIVNTCLYINSMK